MAETSPPSPTPPREPVPYLSPAWLALADEALSTLPPVPEPIVIAYRITDAPVGLPTDGHRLVLGPDRVSMSAGSSDATVTLSLGWDLAVAIARGAAGAQRAVLDGRIALSGDTGPLVRHHRHLGVIDDRLADLRERTDFGP